MNYVVPSVDVYIKKGSINHCEEIRLDFETKETKETKEKLYYISYTLDDASSHHGRWHGISRNILYILTLPVMGLKRMHLLHLTYSFTVVSTIS